MANHNSLAALFQDIADKLRDLRGRPNKNISSQIKIVADNFPSDIESYKEGYLPFNLPYYTTTVQAASGTKTFTSNNHVRIYADNNKLYTLLEWNEMWVANGKTRTGMPTPIGYALDKFDGEVEILHFEDFNTTTFYDPQTFTTARTRDMTCTVYNNYISTWFSSSQLITSWNGVKDIIIYDLNQGISDIYCTNTKQHFFLKASYNTTRGNSVFAPPSSIVFNPDMGDNKDFEDRTYNFWVANEWLRHRYAIPSGLTIMETDNGDEIPNGTVRSVEIFNSNGNTAAVNEDMYFWIYSPSDLEYKNTGILAKYNYAWTSTGTAYNITDTVRNNIYTKEKAAGVNMNNTGINSGTKRQFAPGIRGAEAVMVDDEWYITTPVPSYTTGSGANLMPVIFDSPAVYYARSKGCSLPSCEGLLRYSECYARCLPELYRYLTSVEGWPLTQTTNQTQYYWSSALYQNNPGIINMNVSYSSNFLRSAASMFSYYRVLPSHRYKPTESKSIYITIPEEHIRQNIKLSSGSYNDYYDIYDLVDSAKVLYWADDFTNSVGDKLYINDELFGTCLETPGSFCTDDESNYVVITQSGGTYMINDVDMREPWGLLKKRLDYAQPALYFDGTAYIDLGTKGNDLTDALEITFKSNAGTVQQRLIAPIDNTGSNVRPCTCSMYINASKRYGFCWNGAWQGLNTDPPGDIGVKKHTYKCDFKNKKLTVDGSQYNFPSGTSPGIESGSNLLICGPSNVASAVRFVGEVYNVKMWRNDVLIRDLTPCGHNPDDEGDNTPGMYDEVNGVYYTNAANSGSFIFIPAAN